MHHPKYLLRYEIARNPALLPEYIAQLASDEDARCGGELPVIRQRRQICYVSWQQMAIAVFAWVLLATTMLHHMHLLGTGQKSCTENRAEHLRLRSP